MNTGMHEIQILPRVLALQSEYAAGAFFTSGSHE